MPQIGACREVGYGNRRNQINAIKTFAEGRDFGETGSYLRIKGIAKGELNPAPENSAITDLEKAPRNADEMVEYEADSFILRPTEPWRFSRAGTDLRALK